MKRRGFIAGILSLFAAPELPTAKGPEYFVGIDKAAAGGDVTILTEVTLTEDLYCRNLHVDGKLNMNGYRVYAYESISFRDHGILVSEKFK